MNAYGKAFIIAFMLLLGIGIGMSIGSLPGCDKGQVVVQAPASQPYVYRRTTRKVTQVIPPKTPGTTEHIHKGGETTRDIKHFRAFSWAGKSPGETVTEGTVTRDSQTPSIDLRGNGRGATISGTKSKAIIKVDRSGLWALLWMWVKRIFYGLVILLVVTLIAWALSMNPATAAFAVPVFAVCLIIWRAIASLLGPLGSIAERLIAGAKAKVAAAETAAKEKQLAETVAGVQELKAKVGTDERIAAEVRVEYVGDKNSLDPAKKMGTLNATMRGSQSADTQEAVLVIKADK